MVVIGALLGSCEFFILIHATRFWHFALAVFLAGMGGAARSGSETAILYDSLLLRRRQQDFEKYMGRLNAWDFTAAMLAALSGSVLASRFAFELNYWVSFVSMLISLVFSLALVEPRVRSKLGAPERIKDYLAYSLQFFRNNTTVLWVLLGGAVTGASLTYVDEFWQLYLKEIPVPVMYFGVFSAGIMLLRLPGNLMAHALKERFTYRTLFLSMTAIFALGLACVSMFKGYAGMIAILAICGCSGIVEPLTSGYLHHRIDSAVRATLDSFQSLGQRALTALVGLGFGHLSTRYSLFWGFGFLGALCLVFLLCFSVAFKEIKAQR